MRREYPHLNLSYSTLPQGFPSSSHIYSQSNIQSRVPSRSRQKSMDRSRDKNTLSYKELGKTLRANTYKPLDNVSLRDITPVDGGNGREIQIVMKRMRDLEGRMMDSEHRVQVLESNNKNNSQLRTALQEFIRKHYAEIEGRDAIKERMDTFEEALGHMASTKADRKQLQNIEIGRYYGLTERYNELQRKHQNINQDIVQLNTRFDSLINKLQPSFQAMNDKYMDLFETHAIKIVDHVNSFTEKFEKQLQDVRNKFKEINGTVEEMKKVSQKGEGTSGMRKGSQVWRSKGDLLSSFGSQLVGVALPGLRLVVNVSVREERRPKSSLNGFKQHIKEQHRQTVKLNESNGSTTSSANPYPNDPMMNSLYDSLDSTYPSSSGMLPPSNTQIAFQKLIYKLDKDYNLLDENDHYLINSSGQHIRLSLGQVALLRENGLFI